MRVGGLRALGRIRVQGQLGTAYSCVAGAWVNARVLDLAGPAQRVRVRRAGQTARGCGGAVKVFALEVDEREAILRVLEHGPAEFAELRAVLLEEHVWRQREGLA